MIKYVQGTIDRLLEALDEVSIMKNIAKHTKLKIRCCQGKFGASKVDWRFDGSCFMEHLNAIGTWNNIVWEALQVAKDAQPQIPKRGKTHFPIKKQLEKFEETLACLLIDSILGREMSILNSRSIRTDEELEMMMFNGMVQLANRRWGKLHVTLNKRCCTTLHPMQFFKFHSELQMQNKPGWQLGGWISTTQNFEYRFAAVKKVADLCNEKGDSFQ